MARAASTSAEDAGDDAAPPAPAQPRLSPHRVLALYRFVPITASDLASLREELGSFLRSAGARGTILLAPEGVNGTISYPVEEEEEGEDDDAVLRYLRGHRYFGCDGDGDGDGDGGRPIFPLRTRISNSTSGHVFIRLKIKVKGEIVTLGPQGRGERGEAEAEAEAEAETDAGDGDAPAGGCGGGGCCELGPVDPLARVGTYVPPGPLWNDLLLDPDVAVIDTRNRYETEIGTFVNAVDPDTFSFAEFPGWVKKFAKGDGPLPNRKPPRAVAMFCTGGIRCEKSTSYVLSRNLFPPDVPVYHLEGGILGYLATVPRSASLWRGECFVFDRRVSLGHGLVPTGTYEACHGCRRPVSAFDRAGPDYVRGVCCRACRGDLADGQLERFRERQRQMDRVERGLAVGPHIHDPGEDVSGA